MRYNVVKYIPSIFACLACIFLIYGIESNVFKENRMAGDEEKFHIPTIVHFYEGKSAQNYPAAMTPGYHMLSSLVYGYSGESILSVRFFTSIITIIFVYLLSYVFYISTNYLGALMSLPAVTSLYIIPSGAWLLPDNISWLFVIGSLLLLLEGERNIKNSFILSFLIMASVSVRQTNIWLILPISSLFAYEAIYKEFNSRSLIRYFISVLPPILFLFYFVYIWGGLTPPNFQGEHTSFSPSSLPFFLSIFSLYSFVYIIPFLYGTHYRLSRLFKVFLNPGLFFGLFVSVIFKTNYSPSSGRVSGLWNVVDLFPTFFGRSTVILVGSVIGSGIIYYVLNNIRRDFSTVLSTSIISFVAINAINEYVYHRYFTGMLIIISSLIILGFKRSNRYDFTPEFLQVIPILTFTLLNAIITYTKLL